MKALVLVLCAMSTLAFADSEIPSRMADGDYSWECWSNVVQQEAGKSTFKRYQDYSKGTENVVNNGDQTVVTNKMNGFYDETAYNMVTVTTSTYQKMTDGTFKEMADAAMTTTIDNQATTKNYTYIRIFGVDQGMFEYNISVSNNGGPEKFGVGETAFQFMEDGRISVASYVREKFSGHGAQREEDVFVPAYMAFVSNSLCVYTKTK